MLSVTGRGPLFPRAQDATNFHGDVFHAREGISTGVMQQGVAFKEGKEDKSSLCFPLLFLQPCSYCLSRTKCICWALMGWGEVRRGTIYVSTRAWQQQQKETKTKT